MLIINNLSYSVGQKQLIKHLSLRFEAGKIHAILGPNGSGKTTLLKTITGIWKPTEGQVLWKGRDLLAQPRKEISKIITFVPQNPFVAFNFTVEQFVGLGLYSREIRIKSKEAKERVEEAMAAADITPFRTLYINELSQGERQRVFIARAVATEAEIILFDEPTSNLDLKYNKIIWELLIKLSKRNKTIIIANHDIIKSKQYCHDFYLLKAGVCASFGTFDEAMTPAIWREVFDIDLETIPLL